METIEDIVKEMREMRQFYGSVMREYADRIEAAHKEREAEYEKQLAIAEEAVRNWNRNYLAEAAENTRLRSALKPVLDADTSVVLNFEETQIVTGHDVAISALYAIDEAKRIYNEKKEGEGNGSK